MAPSRVEAWPAWGPARVGNQMTGEGEGVVCWMGPSFRVESPDQSAAFLCGFFRSEVFPLVPFSTAGVAVISVLVLPL